MKIIQVFIRRVFQGGGPNVRADERAGVAVENHSSAKATADQRTGISARLAAAVLRTRQQLGMRATTFTAAVVRADQRVGISVRLAPAYLLAARVTAGVAVVIAALLLLTRQQLGIAAITFTKAGATAQQRSGLSAANRCSAAPVKVDGRTGPRIVQYTHGLVRRVGGNAVVETAVATRTDWASDANVISGANGKHDGSSATFAGNLLGARGGQLELEYANLVNKSALTIQQVLLHFYGSVAGTALNNADVQLRWSKGGAFTTLETITADVNFLAAPKTFDITSQITSWADLDALRTAFRAESALGETWTANADACEVEITASQAVAL